MFLAFDDVTSDAQDTAWHGMCEKSCQRLRSFVFYDDMIFCSRHGVQWREAVLYMF